MSNEEIEVGSDLDSLDADDLVRVERLIAKLARNKGKGKATKPVKTNPAPQAQHGPRKRKNPEQTLDNEPSEAMIGRDKGNPRRGRSGPVGNNQYQGPADGRKRQARIAPFHTGPRHNEFLDMREAKSKNADKKADEALSAGVELTPRGERGSPFIEAQCQICGYYFDVSPEFVHYDTEKGALFTCNDCAATQKS
mgnify:CR=1 FL=1